MNLDIKSSVFLRGALSILIILHHLQYSVSLPYFSIFKSLGAPAVSIFFFLSGYGLMYSYLRNSNTYITSFWKNRFPKIIIPFVLVSIFYFILKYFDQGKINDQIIYNLIVLGNPPLPYSWFVYTIILFYLAFYFIFSPKAKGLNLKITLSFLLVTTYIVITKEVLGYERAWWVSSLAFPMGLFFKYKEEYINQFLNSKIKHLLSIIILLVSCLFLISFREEWLYIVIYSLLPLLLMFFINLIPLPNFKLIVFLGGFSFEIYLLHGIWIDLLRGNTIYLNSDYIYILFIFILTVSSSYFLSKTLNWIK